MSPKIFKFFLEMIPLGVKTCGESEFDIFKAKKCFPDSEKVYVLKRKVAKMRFCDFSLLVPSLNRRSVFSYCVVAPKYIFCFYKKICSPKTTSFRHRNPLVLKI